MRTGPGKRSFGGFRRLCACSVLLLGLLSLNACTAPAVTPAAPPASTPATAPAAPSVEPTPATKVPTPTAEPAAPAEPIAFSTKRVLADTLAIEEFGVRVPGSPEEKAAADYVADRLRSMGYDVTIETFKVPGGISRNVTARVAGDVKRTLVLGGHLDTRPITPGANDNALGCAIVLEMARIFHSEKPPVSLEFTLFGSEEYNDGTPRDHHRGSRYHVAHMTKTQRSRTFGMISIDVVGYGKQLYTRTMGIGPKTMSDFLIERAGVIGTSLKYLKDPGPTGWSDHEPYEKAGIPAVWLERLQDPQYHKKGDTTAHLQKSAVRLAGSLVLDAIRNMDEAAVAGIAGE
jgi:aminopeptidase YwaD